MVFGKKEKEEGKTKPMEKKERFKECEICGKKFTPNNNKQKYCSEGCRRLADYHKNYEHRKPRIQRSNAMKKYKVVSLATFGYKCVVCGWNELEKAKEYLNENEMFEFAEKLAYEVENGIVGTCGLEIHHIIPVSEGGDDKLENLIPLCPNCHRLAHKKIISEEILRKKMKENKVFEIIFKEDNQ